MRLNPGWRSMAKPLVPEEFPVPDPLSTAAFRLEPLDERHADGDYAAWSSSIPHIRATPGFVGWSWPPDAMTPEENLESVRRHARHHAARVGFTYAVLAEPDGVVVGCVYVYPARDGHHGCEVRSWVSAWRADLDRPVHALVVRWLREDWPFGAVLAHERPCVRPVGAVP